MMTHPAYQPERIRTFAVLLAAMSGSWAGHVLSADEQRPSGGSAASAPAAPAPGSDQSLARHRRTVEALRNRPSPHVEQVAFRFGVLEQQPWPELDVADITASPSGPEFRLVGDRRTYRAGDTVRGARVVRVAAGEVTFEFSGERRRFAPPRIFPTLVVRAIRRFEGDLVAFIDGERRPVYAGDTVKEARVVKIEPDAVTLTFGAETRRILPVHVKKPFPEVSFAGYVEMAGGPVVFIRNRSSPCRVGDQVDGATVREITRSHVTLEFGGEVRQFPVR